ncbi:hypothetical protein COV06_02215 [Candidatus Uhrbacteria bacterium CG10_big_fil_rev_8_21_14_0_10_50_16]|uniref:Glycosyltransferase 2-like domain-containing protein n=1 Tax=Candidatus Uhrbacteria bacterium CG10_big_fil_rev_8_21_14_0_10_50_16 TaxID=1975039 RepID=A0A2H0RML4_9BACT|nr:MAG: hypothetical protein COV06_02215 [Candidatus Uhrbacteria bacterium CG10_big_fil_rev_8_21_14_0_10_50_16]
MHIAVIPAFNEATQIAEVIQNTSAFVDCVVVVDDGSRDNTAQVARDAGAIVVQHPINRGLGATLGTGIKAARALGGEVIITLDADGQHLPSEIPLFIEAIKNGYDAVLGSRMLELKGNMPFKRRVYQRIGNLLTYTLFGLFVSDSQSGFRAFSGAAADVLEIRTDRMEVSSEIVSEIRRKQFSWTEVPITAIYTDYSMSKGQSFGVGVKTAMKLILHRLKS